ncbi:GNAT family N-acetyltransferase [Glacieibacterium megasporae]|uniref:GNAT family N-acetyltransferase n=1 Tax=Glacieibacterium megasporae TaxID=2835787 RepID=UPI001C1E2677|nr:GNAT family N-acetyltransferase [Polymorphobacter megasporae]UAJ10584.1 GNAT family N-acetyltransferase [Polymorphobacter megasporae]
MDDITLSLARSPADLASVRILFKLYAAELPIDLGYQDFDAELGALPSKYAEPAGCLLLARRCGAPVGSVGLRPLDEPGTCEMKRFFVAPGARGSGLGLRLAAEAVHEATRRGYWKLLLDTLETMTSAIALYQQLGFVNTAAYYGPVPAGTIFMVKKLPAAPSRSSEGFYKS